MGLFGSKKNPEDLKYDAMSMMEKNQPKAAISLFNKILKENDSDSDALLNKGLALNQIRKYSDAVTCFDKLLEIECNNLYKNELIIVKENLGLPIPNEDKRSNLYIKFNIIYPDLLDEELELLNKIFTKK